MISNKDLRVEGSDLIINGEKHPLDPAVIALNKRANIVQGKLSALDTRIDAIEALEKTASGNPISLTGVAEAYAMGLTMTIEPIQDLHGYDKPWAGGAGKNKFNEDTVRMGDYNNTTTTTRYSQNVSDRIKCTAGTSYIISAQDADITNGTLIIYVRVTDASNNIIDDDININNHLLTTPLTVTANNNGYLTVIFGCSLSGDTTRPISLDDIKGADVMIRLATETDPTYEPYSNICPISGLTSGEVSTTDGTDTNTATITFGQTVYGGSVNFRTGEVTVTHGMADLGTLNWNKTSTSGTHWEFISNTLATLAKFPTRVGITNTIKCSIYTEKNVNDLYGGTSGIGLNIATYKQLIVCDETYTDAATFKTAMSGVQLCYELATPTTLTLTSAELELLKGANTISGNGVTISISYIGR